MYVFIRYGPRFQLKHHLYIPKLKKCTRYTVWQRKCCTSRYDRGHPYNHNYSSSSKKPCIVTTVAMEIVAMGLSSGGMPPTADFSRVTEGRPQAYTELLRVSLSSVNRWIPQHSGQPMLLTGSVQQLTH